MAHLLPHNIPILIVGGGASGYFAALAAAESIPGHQIHMDFLFLWIEFIPVANPPDVGINLKELFTLDIFIGNLFETIIFLAILNNLCKFIIN